jgi:hypothetical protein
MLLYSAPEKPFSIKGLSDDFCTQGKSQGAYATSPIKAKIEVERPLRLGSHQFDNEGTAR